MIDYSMYYQPMTRLLFALVSAAAILLSQAPPGTSADRGLAEILNFETQHPGQSPGGWAGGPAGTIFVDRDIVHGGRWSARIERTGAPDGFSSMTKFMPLDFKGSTIEFRGFIRTEDVTGFAGLWMREDGDSGMVAFDNMQSRQLKGTTDWAEYSIKLPVSPAAKQLFFGFLVGGTGKAWVDDLQLLVDGKPIWEAPPADRPKTALDLDHEFDGGSGIGLTTLTKVQIENLATLGKVWGFLKYHHPLVASGAQHWDYALFRIMPAVLKAGDRTEANAALARWVESPGAVPACKPCATLAGSDIHLRPELDWISDERLLGAELSRMLRAIHVNRSSGKQFFVRLAPGVGNPIFEHEPNYQTIKLPDAGYQILAVYRFWNIVQYWFPYRDVIGENWHNVLAEFIPRIGLAKDTETYYRESMALIARVHDTHANLWSSLKVRPPTGDCQLPVVVRFVENRPVVAGYSDPTAGPATGIKPGDIIQALDGSAISELIERWKPYYAASNETTRLRDIARQMTHGACADSRIRVRREAEVFEITAKRLPITSLDMRAGTTHDLPGEACRRLSDKVGYLKLSSVVLADVPKYIEFVAGTEGLIIDIRNYPAAFVVFALGSRLIDKPTEFARFTNGDLSNPGAFHWTKPVTLNPQQPGYAGKIVILVDDTSISQAEYTSMAFRASPRAVVVGSTTAGADGNVSAIPLPGGLRTMISGIGVFYPDKRPTQRVGIVPDVEVKPTIAGIRAGRDEVLEEALRQILGKGTPAEQIQRLAKP